MHADSIGAIRIVGQVWAWTGVLIALDHAEIMSGNKGNQEVNTSIPHLAPRVFFAMI